MSLSFRIILTRDSVCMGDDVEDHRKIIDIVPQSSTHKTIMNIAKNYLPNVMGHGHTWNCFLDGKKIAVINGNCDKITPLENTPFFSNGCELNFKYHSATY